MIVMIVLLNDACTCAMPSATFLRIFSRSASLRSLILFEKGTPAAEQMCCAVVRPMP